MLHSMMKRKLTSPLSWFFEPKTTVVDLLGTQLTYIEESVLSGKRISNITFTKPDLDISRNHLRSISDWSCWDRPDTWAMDTWFTVGKPTLKVTKKEDIKFAY